MCPSFYCCEKAETTVLGNDSLLLSFFIEIKTSSVRFFNSLIVSTGSASGRVHLQHELEMAGYRPDRFETVRFDIHHTHLMFGLKWRPANIYSRYPFNNYCITYFFFLVKLPVYSSSFKLSFFNKNGVICKFYVNDPIFKSFWSVFCYVLTPLRDGGRSWNIL